MMLCNRKKNPAYLISKTSSKIECGKIVQFFFTVQTKPRDSNQVKRFDKPFFIFQ